MSNDPNPLNSSPQNNLFFFLLWEKNDQHFWPISDVKWKKNQLFIISQFEILGVFLDKEINKHI